MPAARADVDADLDTFNAALDEFLRATRRVRGRAAVRPPGAGELSHSQFQLLDGLERAEGPLTLGAVAELAGVTPPTATRMLDGLEREGIVKRGRAAGDRRCVRIGLTESGADAVRRAREHARERRSEIFAGLSAGERRQAARVLSSLAAALEERA